MRGIYQPIIEELQVGDEIVVESSNYHHLVHVVRAKVQDEILVFQGYGTVFHTLLERIDKKSLTLKILEIKLIPKKEAGFEVFVGRVKKEALESIIKSSVELGLEKINFFTSDYSQKKYPLNQVRLDSIIESGMIQSNNPHKIKIVNDCSFDDINFLNYHSIYYFSLDRRRDHLKGQQLEHPKKKQIDKNLIIIGPEGGFSQNEDEKISRFSHVKFIALPSFILRTKTALPTVIGYYWGQKNKLEL